MAGREPSDQIPPDFTGQPVQAYSEGLEQILEGYEMSVHSINVQKATEQAELDILKAKADYWQNLAQTQPPADKIGAGIAWAGFWIGLGLMVLGMLI